MIELILIDNEGNWVKEARMGWWGRVKEKANVGRRMSETFMSEYGERMKELRETDDRVRIWVKDLEDKVDEAKTLANKFLYLDAIDSLYEIKNALYFTAKEGKKLKDISDKQFVRNISVGDRPGRNYLQYDEGRLKEAGMFSDMMARRQMRKIYGPRFKQYDAAIKKLIASAETTVQAVQDELDKMESFRIGGKIEPYLASMQQISRLQMRFAGTFDSEYKKNFTELQKHRAELDQEAEALKLKDAPKQEEVSRESSNTVNFTQPGPTLGPTNTVPQPSIGPNGTIPQGFVPGAPYEDTLRAIDIQTSKAGERWGLFQLKDSEGTRGTIRTPVDETGKPLDPTINSLSHKAISEESEDRDPSMYATPKNQAAILEELARQQREDSAGNPSVAIDRERATPVPHRQVSDTEVSPDIRPGSSHTMEVEEHELLPISLPAEPKGNSAAQIAEEAPASTPPPSEPEVKKLPKPGVRTDTLPPLPPAAPDKQQEATGPVEQSTPVDGKRTDTGEFGIPDLDITKPIPDLDVEPVVKRVIKRKKPQPPQAQASSVEAAMLKVSHEKFFNELNKVAKTGNQHLMTQMILKYSEMIDSKDPELSQELIGLAERFLD